MTDEKTLKNHYEYNQRMKVLEKHLGKAFYKTGEIHNKIDDAILEVLESNRLEEGWIKPIEKLPQKSKDLDAATSSDDLFFLVKVCKEDLEYCYGYYDTRNKRWYDKLSQNREGDYHEYYTDMVIYWRELPPKPRA